MPHRHESPQTQQFPLRFQLKLAHALRATYRNGYHFADFRADLLAAIIVGTVALPLSMALAIATGVPPQYGLYTAIFAGAIIALLGGSSVQVSGPTAAFVVILAPITQQFGLSGLLLATLLAGVILLLMGATGLGQLIHFIPYPVTSGFTAGIGVVIATLQLKDFFGLTVVGKADHYHERVAVLYHAAHTISLPDTFIGALTLALLIFLPKLTRKLPAPIIALPFVAILAYVLTNYMSGFHVATIKTLFGGIPQVLPTPAVPWNLSGPDGASLDIRALIGPAFAIAMLGAIESLLSAVIADGMTGRKHDPDAELVAQGIGNIIAPFFGGIAATGAIARTATNIRAGARSPWAGFFHSVFVLLAMMVFAPLLGYLPMASLAALLMLVAWNMSEVKHILRTVRIAPRSDILVLAICFGLTVIFDMVISVSVGVVLAALLFMRRMADLATFKLMGENHPALTEPLPKGTLLYEIAGPLFFGAAQKAVSALRTVDANVRLVILDLRAVPTMDATGLVNLESALDALHRAKVFVVIAGVQNQPLHLMAKAGWRHRPWLVVLRSFDEGVALARSLTPADYDDHHGNALPPIERAVHH